MRESTKLMTFDEFRSSSDVVAARHREHFRDRETAEELLRAGQVSALGWPEWPDDRAAKA